MNLDITIPTRNRREKLTNCINSILLSAKNISINIYIYFHNKENLDYFNNCFKDVNEIKLRMTKNYKAPVFWNNHLKNMKSDAMCYLSDDTLFFEDTLELIMNYFPKYFPDFDGLLGLNQYNIPSSQAVCAAFGIIGSKYADRFPERQVFCPDYFRFYDDRELELFAMSIGKFVFNKNIKVKHMHPAFDSRLLDDTHNEVRKCLRKDRETFEKRQQLNYLWGKNFNLLNKR